MSSPRPADGSTCAARTMAAAVAASPCTPPGEAQRQRWRALDRHGVVRLRHAALGLETQGDAAAVVRRAGQRLHEALHGGLRDRVGPAAGRASRRRSASPAPPRSVGRSPPGPHGRRPRRPLGRRTVARLRPMPTLRWKGSRRDVGSCTRSTRIDRMSLLAEARKTGSRSISRPGFTPVPSSDRPAARARASSEAARAGWRANGYDSSSQVLTTCQPPASAASSWPATGSR